MKVRKLIATICVTSMLCTTLFSNQLAFTSTAAVASNTSYLELGNISTVTTSSANGTGWMCGNSDYIKFAMKGWGTNDLWGHITVSKADGSFVIKNNGTSTNPPVLLYSFGTKLFPSKILPISPDSYLDLAVTANIKFKYVIGYDALDSTGAAVKTGYMEISKDTDGKLVAYDTKVDLATIDGTTDTTKVSAASATNAVPFNCTKNMMDADSTINDRVSLAAMANGVSGCTSVRVYCIGVVVDTTQKGYTMTFSKLSINNVSSPITEAKIGDTTGTISGNNISFVVPNGTDLTSLTPAFTTSTILSNGAAVGTIPTEATVSLSGAQDFSANPVNYTVSLLGASVTYVVTVTAAPAITEAKIGDITGTISGNNISFVVPNGTDLTSLTPTFTTSTGATVSLSGAQDFSAGAVNYTVSLPGASVTYVVTVTAAPVPIVIEPKYINWNNITATHTDGSSLNSWYCGNSDSSKDPFNHTWGCGTLFGHLNITKNANNQLVYVNSGSGSTTPTNPTAFRYMVGANAALTNAPSTASSLSINDYLYLNATSDSTFKLVLGFGAVNPSDNTKKNKFMEIYWDGSQYATKITDATITDNSAVYSKASNMSSIGTHSSAVSLAGLANGIEGCTEAHVYFIDLVVGATAACNITFDFNAPASEPTTDDPIKSTACDISAAKIGSDDGVITGANIAVTVPYKTDVTKLTPDFTISADATISPTGVQDFTNPVKYTVTAADGTTIKQYTLVVTVTAAPAPIVVESKYINWENITATHTDGSSLNSWYCGNSDSSKDPFNHTWGCGVLFGHLNITKNATNQLVYVNSGSGTSPTNPTAFRYMVGANAALTNAPSTDSSLSINDYLYLNATSDSTFKLVLGFGAVNPSDNTEKNKFMEIYWDGSQYATKITDATTTDNSAVYSKASNMSSIGTHSSAVSLAGLANGIEGCTKAHVYFIDLVVGATAACNITFDFNAPANEPIPDASIKSTACDISAAKIGSDDGVITGSDIAVTVPYRTDVTKLTPSFTISANATISPTGVQDFTNPVKYTVAAADGTTTKEYTLNVTVADKVYINWSGITGTPGAVDNFNNFTLNSWYCGNGDSIKRPLASLKTGCGILWGHISIAKNSNNQLVFKNNGSDKNPSVLRYLVGADDKLANAPSAATPISIYDNLYVNATADGSFKLVIGFAAIDPNTNEKKYGFAQISKDSNGNFVTIVSESDPSDNSAVFSKTTNMINAGTQKGAVSLEGLANGIEGCSQAYIYSIDVVVGADKAFNMTLDFTPSGEANAGNSSPSTGETALPIAATVLLVASIGAVVVFKKKEN